MCYLYERGCLLADILLYSVDPVGGRPEIAKSRVEKLPRQSGNRHQLSNSRKAEADGDANNWNGPLPYEDMSRRGINLPVDMASADKVHFFRLTKITVIFSGMQ